MGGLMDGLRLTEGLGSFKCASVCMGEGTNNDEASLGKTFTPHPVMEGTEKEWLKLG